MNKQADLYFELIFAFSSMLCLTEGHLCPLVFECCLSGTLLWMNCVLYKYLFNLIWWLDLRTCLVRVKDHILVLLCIIH